VDRQAVVRVLSRQVQRDPLPVIQRIVSRQKTFDLYPLASHPTWHDPARWAKGVAPQRTPVAAGTPAHAAVRQQIPRVSYLPELRQAVFYDWARGRVVRRAQPLSDEESFANLLAGYPPGSDETVAQALAVLDQGRAFAKVAAWAEHLYADLDAKAYESITLYEAWYSGTIVSVPDVDAVPFAVEILATQAFKSPIPAGPARTRLYQQIAGTMFEYRKYRTLREAAAAAAVAAEPEIDSTYQPLLPRFHYLYAVSNEDHLKVADQLKHLGSREEFLAWADRNVKQSAEAYEQREERKKELQHMAVGIRRRALDALARTEARLAEEGR
jgi:hypothetical protein